MIEEKTFTLDELDKLEADPETTNTYSLDDLDRLDSWSNGKNVFLTAAENFGKGFASDLAHIPDQIGQLIKETGEKGGAGLAIPSFNDGVNLARSMSGKEIEKGPQDEILIKVGDMLSTKNKEFVDRLNLKPEEGSQLAQISFDLGQGASTVATSVGLMYATRSPALLFGLFGSRQKASLYEEAREAGKDPAMASIISSAGGLIEGGIEAVGGMAFLKGISFNKFITRALVQAGREGMEEALQQGGEEVLTQTTGVRKDSLQDSLLRVGYSAALGVVLGAPVGAIKASQEKTGLKKEIMEHGFTDEQATKIMEKVTEKTVESKSVNQEIANFLEEEMQKTEKMVNENPEFQPIEIPAEQMLAEEGDIYAQNFQAQKKAEKEIGLKPAYENVAQATSKALEPISTRLKQINPKLKEKLKRFEYNLKQRVLADEKSVKPFLESYRKLSEKDQSDLDLALKNNDKEKIKEITERNKMTEQYKSVRGTLNAIYERTQETGLDLGFIEEYFPRKVSDYEGMLKSFQKQDTWPEMQKAINEKEENLGRKLNDEEKVELVNNFLKAPKGRSSKPGNVKTREISQVTADLNRFYQKSPEALMQYIYRLNDFLESRRFFGKSAKGSDLSEQTIDASIGAFVLDQLEKGTINGQQAKEISNILRARFLQKGTSGVVSSVKNLTYIETMGNITSAITQIGDIGLSLYKNGFYNTGKALSKAIANQSVVSKNDLAIERILEEFSDRTKLGKALDNVFKWVGLNYMDNLGKETFINGALDRLSNLANNPTTEFNDEMKLIFEDEAGEVIEDLKAKKTSDNVKYLLFSELADVQPIALSEMPELYLTSGNGRLFYMLKTYTIKLIDVFRNEAFLKMKTDPVKGITNLIRLTSMVILANATADIIKDLLLGRPLEWPDYLANNIWRLFGLSKYSFYKFKTEGVSQGVASAVLPPVAKFVTNTTKDVANIIDGKFEIENSEVIQGVPFLGKLYYWWFGGGRAKIEKKNRRRG